MSRTRHKCRIGLGQVRAGDIAAFALIRAIGKFTLRAVAIDVVHIRCEIDAVAFDGPVKSACPKVDFSLADALRDWRKSGILFRFLDAGIDNLTPAHSFGSIDGIAMLLNTFIGWGPSTSASTPTRDARRSSR